jgi:hypothetical protein
VPDTLHLPLHHTLLLTSHLHPLLALALTFIFSILWLWSAFFTIVLAISAAPDADNGGPGGHWHRLLYAAAACEVVFGCCYVVYFRFAVVALRRWRVGSKERKAVGGLGGGNVIKLGVVGSGNERGRMVEGT